MRDKSNLVKTGRRILLLGTILLSGCGGGRDSAESSFRVIDAPANYVQRPTGRSETRTTTTTTVSTDAVTPGRTVTAAPKSREQPTVQTQPGPASTPRVTRNTSGDTPRPSPSPAPRSVASPPTSYPTAKAVPDKPGYVFSPYDPNGGYVDVSGFSPGSKVKDPYSGKIFLVP